MSWFNNLGMKVKLIGGFSVAALITAVVAVFGIFQLKSLVNMGDHMYQVAVAPASYLQELNQAFLTVRIQLRQVMLARSPEMARQGEAKMATAYAVMDSNVAALGRAFAADSSANADSVRAFLSRIGPAVQDYQVIAVQIADLAKVGRLAESVALTNSPRIVAITATAQAAIDGVEGKFGDLGTAISAEMTRASSRATTTMLVILAVGFLLCLGFGLFISTVIAKPLGQAVEMIKEMGVGRLGRRLKLGRKDEIGVLADTMDLFAENLQTSVLGTMKKIAAGDLSTDVKLEDAKDEIAPALQGVTLALRGLVAEAGTLSKAAVEGKLATRGDATKYQGAYRDIVKGVNDCLDAVIGPLNVAAEYVDRISKGDIPPKITDNYNGDFNEIKNNLNVCIDALNGLVNEMNTMSKEHNAGDIDVKIPVEKFQGRYQVMAGGVNDMVFGHIAVKKKAMACLKEFGQGNFEAPLEKFPGKKAFINDTFEQVRANLKALIADAEMLGKAAVEGKLATRADATKHQGDFRKIVQGVNNTLDAVIGPLNVAAEYVDRISKGDIPPKITDNYNGDFNEIKNNLNVCIDALNGLVNEMNTMSKEHDAGDIDVKVPVEKFQGSYKVMAGGVNDMVFGHIAVKKKAMACLKEFGQGNFDAPLEKFPGKKAFINDTFEQVRANLKALIADTNMLVKAAVEGKLATRADAAKHQGDFHKIVQGVNDTLDAVILPVNEAAKVLESMARRDLTQRVMGDYQGDHANIKNALNGALEAIQGAVSQLAGNVTMIAGSAEEMSAVSATMGSNAEETSAQSNVASAAAEQVSKNVQTVATGTEEMSASIREIAKNASEAARIASSAVEVAERTNATVAKLGVSSTEIGNVIKVITSIAEQTNLLALNATIEAARAGEAGKGFAVVANEVKELAKETAKATEDIGGKIAAIQSDTEAAVAAIGQIAGVINQINDISNTIASAVEEQTATTNEIGRNVAEAATGSNEIAKNITSVAQAAQSTSQGAANSQTASAELARMAGELQKLVDQFHYEDGTQQATGPRLHVKKSKAA